MVMLPITGGAYQHASQDVNYQRCVNWFPTEIGPNGLGIDDPQNQPSMEGIGKGALIQSPGNKLLIDLGGQECRGIFTIQNKYVYAVVDDNLYQLTINPMSRTATSIFIGNLNTSTGPVSMVNNYWQLFITDSSPTAYLYMSNTYGTCTMGPIGGSAGNTYTLTIQGYVIYNAVNVATALTATQVIAQINTFTTTTGITASTGGTGIVNLTATGPVTITITESGTGFVAGTNGLTVSGGNFASGVVNAYQIINSTNGYNGGQIVIFNDGYFLYNQPGTNTIWNSNTNDGTNWNELDYFSAETKPCLVNGLAVNKGEIWIFGDTLTEVWYDAANAPPASPYSYRVGSGMDIGCCAPHSIVAMELINIWLDSRGFVAISDISPYIRNNNSGYDMRIVSTPAQHAEWATYPTITDAIATYFIDRGHVMYMLTFPTAQKTWVYDFPARPMRMSMSQGEWHERTYLNPTTFEEEYYLIQYIAKFEQMNIGAGIRSGKIYDFSYKYYTDDGAPIRCTRTTATATNDFKYSDIAALWLRMETGEALQSGNGSIPQVFLRYSNDGGHTWSQIMARNMGQVGQYNHKILWERLGSAEEWIFEFSVQEPIKYSLIKASADVSAMEER